MQTITVDATTDTGSLVGGTFTDRLGDKFTIVTADHSPEANVVAYGGRGDAEGRFNGGTVMGFLPYGAVLEVH